MRIVLAVITAFLAVPALAQTPSCGEPPRVDDQSLKGDLEGKAQFLSSLVGNANLKGQTEAVRTDIFSNYPKASKTRSDAYLQYMFCSFVLSDPKLSAQEKFAGNSGIPPTLAGGERQRPTGCERIHFRQPVARRDQRRRHEHQLRRPSCTSVRRRAVPERTDRRSPERHRAHRRQPVSRRDFPREYRNPVRPQLPFRAGQMRL